MGENQTKMNTLRTTKNLFGEVVPRNCKVEVSSESPNFYEKWTAGIINYVKGMYITDRLIAKREGLKIIGYNVRY